MEWKRIASTTAVGCYVVRDSTRAPDPDPKPLLLHTHRQAGRRRRRPYRRWRERESVLGSNRSRLHDAGGGACIRLFGNTRITGSGRPPRPLSRHTQNKQSLLTGREVRDAQRRRPLHLKGSTSCVARYPPKAGTRAVGDALFLVRKLGLCFELLLQLRLTCLTAHAALRALMPSRSGAATQANRARGRLGRGHAASKSSIPSESRLRRPPDKRGPSAHSDDSGSRPGCPSQRTD